MAKTDRRLDLPHNFYDQCCVVLILMSLFFVDITTVQSLESWETAQMLVAVTRSSSLRVIGLLERRIKGFRRGLKLFESRSFLEYIKRTQDLCSMSSCNQRTGC